MDFGIARIRGTQRLTQAGLVGTWAYLAPEQFRRSEGSERSDVYSFACVVYEMLTGRVPFEAPSEAEMMRGHLDLPPPPLAAILPQIDQRVNDAVLKALSKEPTMRFASIGEFAEALGAVAQERVSTATIRDRILSRMPMLPPLPPIEISEPGATHRDAVTFGRTGTHSGTHAGAGRKNWLIPGLLGSAGIAALAAIGFVVLGSRPPPALPVLDNEPEPHIAPHTPVPPNPQPPPIVPVVRQDQTALIPPTPQGSATPAFVRSQGVKPLASLSVTELMQQNLTPELIMAEAERRIASGGAQPVTDGLALLKYLVGPPFHNPQAAAKLAQLYDPLQTSRPPGLSPSADLAAMNYGIASRNGDQKAADEREKLRQYLQQQSQGSGQSAASATTLLRRYWPQ
jgi:serine/threonine protein kinase